MLERDIKTESISKETEGTKKQMEILELKNTITDQTPTGWAQQQKVEGRGKNR